MLVGFGNSLVVVMTGSEELEELELEELVLVVVVVPGP